MFSGENAAPRAASPPIFQIMNNDTSQLIQKYYPSEPRLHSLLLQHSKAVTNKALEIAKRHPELNADREFIARAAMLHDIGIAACDAPGIFCFGSLPYICHGIEGARILAEDGLLEYARVCERHTGAGLTAEEILEEGLPLPPRNMLPISIEEKIICYADKFFSKNPDKLLIPKPLAKIIKEMARFGKAPLERFMALHTLLS